MRPSPPEVLAMRLEVHVHADIPILEGVSKRQLEQAFAPLLEYLDADGLSDVKSLASATTKRTCCCPSAGPARSAAASTARSKRRSRTSAPTATRRSRSTSPPISRTARRDRNRTPL